MQLPKNWKSQTDIYQKVYRLLNFRIFFSIFNLELWSGKFDNYDF